RLRPGDDGSRRRDLHPEAAGLLALPANRGLSSPARRRGGALSGQGGEDGPAGSARRGFRRGPRRRCRPPPAPLRPRPARRAGGVVHVFTHFHLELNVYCAGVGWMENTPPGCWWAPAESLPGEALPSVMKKVLEAAIPGSTARRRGRRKAA